MVQGQHGKHRLDATGASEQMPGHRLGGIDHHTLGVLAQRRLDGVGLVGVSQRRGRAVGVQVIDLVGINPGIAHGRDHGASRTVHIGRGHMTGVGAHAKASQLGVNPGATGFGVFVLFEHHHTAALAQHKTVAVFVPGARGGGRVVIAGAQGAHGGKAAHAQWRNGSF